MSGGSSSSRARPADIIDLDRYMRAAVRPAPARASRLSDGLVVDAGGVGRGAPAPGALSDSSAGAPRAPSPRNRGPHHKRYSHDSGLSDGSFVQRRHRPNRRVSDSIKSRESSRRNESAASMREFRTVCERALRDQQQQIARVAELCERLAQPNVAPPAPSAGPTMPSISQEHKEDRRNFSQRAKPQRIVSSETSDISSTSRSTRDARRRDHIPESCKTYKIIMNKLDELNRVFASRRPTSPARPARSARSTWLSSGSVTVCDKLVATDPLAFRRTLTNPTVQMVRTSRPGGAAGAEAEGGSLGGERRALAVTEAHLLDIAPALRARTNVATESIVRRAGGSGEDVRASLHIDPDLDDPLHFYAQAKRLQALHATTNRLSEADSGDVPCKSRGDSLGCKSGGESTRKSGEESLNKSGGESLCAVCRGAWRALRRCLTHQLFGTCS